MTPADRDAAQLALLRLYLMRKIPRPGKRRGDRPVKKYNMAGRRIG